MHFSQEHLIELQPREQKQIVFSPEQFPQLRFTKPRLWWPNGWGKANLYTLTLAFDIDHKSSDITLTRFGIRDVADYFNDQGHRGSKSKDGTSAETRSAHEELA